MEPILPTTPFGRRTLSLAHVASQMVAKQRKSDTIVHKWKVFRVICMARPMLGVSERALSVLNALLTFHPETTLTGEALTVFPSNEQLSLRAHGMPASTLRRHLAGLVDAGLVIRRDSPNGKRYARKGRGGETLQAFGFDLSPIVARADEFESLAAEIEAEARALKFAREKITLCRRDIAKMIAVGIEEGVPTRPEGQGPASWQEVHAAFRGVVEGIPRTAARVQVEEAADRLSQLADDIRNLLETQVKTSNLDANESQNERHIQNSNPEPFFDLEPASERSGGGGDPVPLRPEPKKEAVFPLGMVLDGCPDLADYAKGGIRNWRDFLAAASVVRPMLGISPSAWADAERVMGEVQAGVVVACILQRGSTIHSAGGYLRELTRKASGGEFSIGPILMSQINSRTRERRSA
jgi:replication initiation protein RepC